VRQMHRTCVEAKLPVHQHVLKFVRLLGCCIHFPSDFGLISGFSLEGGMQAKEKARTQRHKDTQLCWVAGGPRSTPGRRTSGIGHLRAARAVCSTNTAVSHGDCRYGSRRWCDAPSRYPARRRHTLASAARAALASWTWRTIRDTSSSATLTCITLDCSAYTLQVRMVKGRHVARSEGGP